MNPCSVLVVKAEKSFPARTKDAPMRTRSKFAKLTLAIATVAIGTTMVAEPALAGKKKKYSAQYSAAKIAQETAENAAKAALYQAAPGTAEHTAALANYQATKLAEETAEAAAKAARYGTTVSAEAIQAKVAAETAEQAAKIALYQAVPGTAEYAAALANYQAMKAAEDAAEAAAKIAKRRIYRGY